MYLLGKLKSLCLAHFGHITILAVFALQSDHEGMIYGVTSKSKLEAVVKKNNLAGLTFACINVLHTSANVNS